MGAGIGLTFDEAALLLDLRDVYWTREGLLSVQLSLGATAILSIAILTLRMLRRGERRSRSERRRRRPSPAPPEPAPAEIAAEMCRKRQLSSRIAGLSVTARPPPFWFA